MERPRFTNPRMIFSDPFGIGQRAVARIAAETSRKAMHECAARAFRWPGDPSPLDLLSEAEALKSIHMHASTERRAREVLAGEV